jgi:hypothetical protein
LQQITYVGCEHAFLESDVASRVVVETRQAIQAENDTIQLEALQENPLVEPTLGPKDAARWAVLVPVPPVEVNGVASHPKLKAALKQKRPKKSMV